MGKRRPEPEMKCAGVLNGRNLSALDVQLRQQGVSDHDRHEILRFASVLGMPDDVRTKVWSANEDADTTNVDLGKPEPEA